MRRYVKSASLLKTIGDVCRKLREWNKDFTYVCDPVMGDDGRLYVPQDVVDTFRTDILPLASILTPNQFEAEVLTGRTIRTPQEGFDACDALIARGPHTVVRSGEGGAAVTFQWLAEGGAKGVTKGGSMRR